MSRPSNASPRPSRSPRRTCCAEDAETDQAAPDRDALYGVAYDEAVRALSEQRALIDSFRARAGNLLSITAVTTSFLGARALADGILNWAAWAALGSFVGVAVLLLAILWSPANRSSVDLRQILEGWIDVDERVSLGTLHRRLALEMQGHFDRNWRELSQLATCFQVASGLLIVEVLGWIATIASTP